LTEWTPDHAELVSIREALHRLVAIQTVVGGGEWRAPAMARRPVTAIEKARAASRKARHESLVAEVMEAQARWAAAHAD
jgi:hypothetical protein